MTASNEAENVDRAEQQTFPKRKRTALKFEELLRRVDAMPTQDLRSENDTLGYDADGLPQ